MRINPIYLIDMIVMSWKLRVGGPAHWRHCHLIYLMTGRLHYPLSQSTHITQQVIINDEMREDECSLGRLSELGGVLPPPTLD